MFKNKSLNLLCDFTRVSKLVVLQNKTNKTKLASVKKEERKM